MGPVTCTCLKSNKNASDYFFNKKLISLFSKKVENCSVITLEIPKSQLLLITSIICIDQEVHATFQSKMPLISNYFIGL